MEKIENGQNMINTIETEIPRNLVKDFDEEMNKLVAYLGGKDNIIDCVMSKSRFKVTLKDVSKANKEGIQKLGAKGIVEIDNQLKIIFDKNSRTLKKYIKDMH